MPTIRLTTLISAPIEQVFDLARDIDAHMESTSKSKERAVAGVTSGLIGMGETVIWEARHLGIKQRLMVKITEFDSPNMFVDEIVSGAFQSMKHTHRFQTKGECTEMIDEFIFESPLGILGKVANKLFLRRYMEKFLIERNMILKRMAESS